MSRITWTHLRADLGSGSFHMDIFEQLHGGYRNWEFLFFFIDLLINIYFADLSHIYLFLDVDTHFYFEKQNKSPRDSCSLHEG